MEFIADPVEQTTALTDALLAVAALICAWRVSQARRGAPFKANLWMAVFLLLAVAGVLGAIAHGFVMSQQTNRRLWQPLYLSLGLTIALFVVGAVYDAWGQRAGRVALPVMLVAGVSFFAVTQIVPGSFRIFILYEAVAMLFALAIYGTLAVRRRDTDASLMTAGVLLTIVAAVVQVSAARVDVAGVPLDHNGLFHMVQIAALPFLVVGVRLGLRRLGQDKHD